MGLRFFKLRSQLLKRFRACIPLFSKHVPRVFEALLDNPEMDEAESEELLHYIWASVTFQIFSETGEEVRLWGDIATFELATRVWLVEWSNEGNAHASRLLALCMGPPNPSSPQAMPEQNLLKRRLLLDIARSRLDFSADDVMSLTLSRFRRSKGDVQASFFGILIFLFGSFKDSKATDVQAYSRAFARHYGAEAFVKSTEKMLKQINVDIDAPDASHLTATDDEIQVVSRCLSVFGLILYHFPGLAITPIKQALSRDLIRILACCSAQCVYSLLDQTGKNSVCSLIGDVLGGSIVARSVLLTARRSIAKYQRSMGRSTSNEYSVSEVFPFLESSDIRERWEIFFRRLYHYSSSFRVIEQERNIVVHACGNVRSICIAKWCSFLTLSQCSRIVVYEA